MQEVFNALSGNIAAALGLGVIVAVLTLVVFFLVLQGVIMAEDRLHPTFDDDVRAVSDRVVAAGDHIVTIKGAHSGGLQATCADCPWGAYLTPDMVGMLGAYSGIVDAVRAHSSASPVSAAGRVLS